MEKEVDRLSELPDDILVPIISRLSFKEATATSILSTRWRPLHKRVFSLNFHTPCLGEIFYKWLEFAFSRKVEIVDLVIVPCWDKDCCFCHRFVSSLISRSSKQSLLGVKELSLSSTFLIDQDMELILSNFVFLDHLSIDSPRKGYLTNIRVVGHCKLTHLNISNIEWPLDSIEVCDMINLVCLRFYKLFDDFVLLLDGVPSLVHFTNDDGRNQSYYNVFLKISSIYHQLLHLKLPVFPDDIERDGLTFTKLVNVKHVELKVIMPCRYGTHQLFPLIEECPSLEKLEIEFSWSCDEHMDIYRWLNHNTINRKKLNNLKRVRLSGYMGSESELELLMYVITNSVGLQELIIQACDLTPQIRQRATACVSSHLQSLSLDSVNLRII